MQKGVWGGTICHREHGSPLSCGNEKCGCDLCKSSADSLQSCRINIGIADVHLNYACWIQCEFDYNCFINLRLDIQSSGRFCRTYIFQYILVQKAATLMCIVDSKSSE